MKKKSLVARARKPIFESLPSPMRRGIMTTYMRLHRGRYFPNFLRTSSRVYKFEGWGMATVNEPPWNGGESRHFIKANEDMKANFNFSPFPGIDVDEHSWRHWIVSYAIRHAIEFAKSDTGKFVECGVCLGMSAFFALRELQEQRTQGHIGDFEMHLYDSWMPMIDDYLLPSEKGKAGEYGDVTIEMARGNLAEFAANTVYHQGYIPESFEMKPLSPESIAYLHIDVNAAATTKSCLEFFFPRMLDGGRNSL